MIRLIAFDLDGTAFDDHKVISDRTRAALEGAAKSGIAIVPATGRPFAGLREAIGHMEGVQYILTTNGAGIYEEKTGRCVHEEAMPLAGFIPMLERLEQLDVMADTFLKGQAYMNENKKKWIDAVNGPEEIRQYIRASRILVPKQSEYLKKRGEDVEKLTINFAVGPDGRRRDYEKAWEIVRDYPCFHAVSGGMQNIEITKSGVSKASGLRWLGGFLGISAEEMLVFGDSGNDIEMIREAGIGVAMQNAEKDVLEAADFVTKSNNDDGIVFALGRFLPS